MVRSSSGGRHNKQETEAVKKERTAEKRRQEVVSHAGTDVHTSGRKSTPLCVMDMDHRQRDSSRQ